MEQLHYNLLYRWFVGLGVDEPVWVPTVFTKNRERLLKAEVAHKFLAELLNHKEVRGLLSDEHFSVDGTQVAAWASMKSFRAKDGSDEPPSGGRNGDRDFHGETRSNDTHASTTDPDARVVGAYHECSAARSYVSDSSRRHGPRGKGARLTLRSERRLGPASAMRMQNTTSRRLPRSMMHHVRVGAGDRHSDRDRVEASARWLRLSGLAIDEIPMGAPGSANTVNRPFQLISIFHSGFSQERIPAGRNLILKYSSQHSGFRLRTLVLIQRNYDELLPGSGC